MRALLLGALVACGSSSSEPDCPSVPASEITNLPGAIVSGTEVLGISWMRQIGRARPEVHGAIVAADGTLGPDIALASIEARGVAGRTTVMWTDRACDGEVRPLSVRLQRGGEVMDLDLSTAAHGLAIAFDGQRYQLFVVSPTGMTHQSIDEDGTRGPLHALDVGVVCPDAASDRAGLTLLRVGADGYIVDADTGALRQVFDGGVYFEFRQSFYFAGQFHVPDGDRLLSFPPTSTGAYTVRNLVGHLLGATRFLPTTSTLFAGGPGGIVEVDADLGLVRRWPAQSFDAGTFGDHFVRWEQFPLDPGALAPGRIELVRETATGAVWRREVAVDSEVRLVDGCGAL